jgi:hypothetical protein
MVWAAQPRRRTHAPCSAHITPNRRVLLVVVIESRSGLLHARLKAALADADRELQFVCGHQLDPKSAGQIPDPMLGRLLDDGYLRKLHRPLIKKKPPA